MDILLATQKYTSPVRTPKRPREKHPVHLSPKRIKRVDHLSAVNRELKYLHKQATYRRRQRPSPHAWVQKHYTPKINALLRDLHMQRLAREAGPITTWAEISNIDGEEDVVELSGFVVDLTHELACTLRKGKRKQSCPDVDNDVDLIDLFCGLAIKRCKK